MRENRGLDRRSFLRTTGVAASLTAGAARASAPMLFTPAAAGRSRSRTYSGRFTGVGKPDWHYVPVDVPRGVHEIEVSYNYEPLSTPVGMSANVVDIGMFGPSGHDPSPSCRRESGGPSR